MSLKDKINNILNILNKHFIMSFLICSSVSLIFISILKLKIFNIHNSIIIYTGLVFGFLVFCFWFFKKDFKKIKIYIYEIFLSLFISILILLILFRFFNINSPYFIDINTILNLILVTAGIIILFTNKKEIISDFNKIKEKNKFDSISILNTQIPLVKKKSAWFYLEDKKYIIILLSILLLGFILRIWDLSYLQGADNFNFLSAKSFAENGSFIYNRNLQITYLIGLLFKFFGSNFIVARIPFVLIGTFSIYLIYLLAKKINKKIGLISAFLLAISPVVIEKSTIVREYSEILMWSILISYILITIYLKYKDSPLKFIKKYSLTVILSSVLVYIYSIIVESGTFKSLISNIFFISIPILFYFIKDNYKKMTYLYIILVLIFLCFFIKFIHIPISIFSPNFVYNPYWFQMFFDPTVQTPMQWFSFSKISTIFLFIFFISPLLINNRIINILSFAFLSTISLFIFKYHSVLGYDHSRYLYYIYPFYITIFATSIYIFYSLGKLWKFKKISSIILLLFIFTNIILFSNTLHGAKHDLSIWNELKNQRQATSYGNRNQFLDVITVLKNNSFSNKDKIIIQGEGSFFIAWFFNFPINKIYKSDNKSDSGNYDNYENGNGIYIVDPSHEINEMETAVNQNKSGYMLWHSSYYPENDFEYKNILFKYITTVDGYKLYKW